MISYLAKYNLSDNDILDITKHFNKGILNNFQLMSFNVISVLDYLTSIGLKNVKELILYRPDILFKNIDELKEKLTSFDNELIIYIFNNDVGSLINFNI